MWPITSSHYCSNFKVSNRGQNVLGAVEEVSLVLNQRSGKGHVQWSVFLRIFHTRDTDQCQHRLLRSDNVCSRKIQVTDLIPGQLDTDRPLHGFVA